MSKAVLVMDMPESCFGCNFLYCNADAGIDSCQAMKYQELLILKHTKNQIGVHFGNCRRKQIILLIVIMEDLIKAGMPA